MSERIFPYKTVAGDFRLDVVEVKVDDNEPHPDPYDRDRRELFLDAQENGKWKQLTLKLELSGPTDELRRAPEAETITATARVQCDATHVRQAVKLRRASDDAAQWTGRLELQRSAFRGAARLHAVVSGTAGGLPNRFLGGTEVWTIHFDKPDISRSGTVAVKWVDFGSPGELTFLKEYMHEPLYSDLAGDAPVVYLNKSKEFRGLASILGDRRRSGQDLALHNAERLGIARSAWMGMLNVAIAGIRPGEEGADPDWPESEWQRRVLKILLPAIFPDEDEGEALKCALEAWQSRVGAGRLESRGQSEINRRIGGAKLLRRTLSLLGGASDESGANE